MNFFLFLVEHLQLGLLNKGLSLSFSTLGGFGMAPPHMGRSQIAGIFFSMRTHSEAPLYSQGYHQILDEKALSLATSAGHKDTTADEPAQNIFPSMNFPVSLSKKHRQNVRSLHVKFALGRNSMALWYIQLDYLLSVIFFWVVAWIV